MSESKKTFIDKFINDNNLSIPLEKKPIVYTTCNKKTGTFYLNKNGRRDCEQYMRDCNGAVKNINSNGSHTLSTGVTVGDCKFTEEELKTYCWLLSSIGFKCTYKGPEIVGIEGRNLLWYRIDLKTNDYINGMHLLAGFTAIRYLYKMPKNIEIFLDMCKTTRWRGVKMKDMRLQALLLCHIANNEHYDPGHGLLTSNFAIGLKSNIETRSMYNLLLTVDDMLYNFKKRSSIHNTFSSIPVKNKDLRLHIGCASFEHRFSDYLFYRSVTDPDLIKVKNLLNNAEYTAAYTTLLSACQSPWKYDVTLPRVNSSIHNLSRYSKKTIRFSNNKYVSVPMSEVPLHWCLGINY